jgi:hypothetical protein
MARSIYNYTIDVLRKVSFDSALFRKELKKASRRLLPYEYNELIIWVKEFTANKPELEGVLV